MNCNQTLSWRHIYFLVLFLSACAGGTTRYEDQTYVPPTTEPSATLINGLESLLEGDDTASLKINIDDCATLIANRTAKHSIYRRAPLFTMKANDLQRSQEIKVPASRPISLSYSSSRRYPSGQSYCSLVFIGSLEEGRQYKVVGGYHTVKTDALIFSDKPGCALGIVDAETMLPVKKIDKICTSN